jgi:uroporphyrin-III C-methyltransferase
MVPPAAPETPVAADARDAPARWPTAAWIGLGLACAAALVAVALSWQAQSRVTQLERELVRRQQDLQGLAAESRVLSKQAEDSAREAVAKSSLLEAKVAEVAVQRGQLEDLIQSLARSRDENVLVDIEAALRVAQQQATLTGSAEPLVATLRQADERLAKYNQPRLEGVRRAIARDLARVRAVGVADVAQLVLRLDEIVRLADELPLLAAVEQGKALGTPAARRAGSGAPAAEAPPVSSATPQGKAATASPAAAPAPAATSTPPNTDAWLDIPAGWARLKAMASSIGQHVADEARSLVRLTRVDQPDAMLLAPTQAYFLRENLKLRLLNARLSLLSRQFDSARAELGVVQRMLEAYFDRGSRKTQIAVEGVQQVASQSRFVPLPRPDDTLAALTTVAGR